MGQTFTDYEKASMEAAHKALQTMHAFEELLALPKSELLQGYDLTSTLTAKGIDRKYRPAMSKSEEIGLTVEEEATSGNLTALIRMKKLAEASPVRNEKGDLPYPFNKRNDAIVPPVLAELLADLNAQKLEKKVVEKLINCPNLTEWQNALGSRPLTDAERKELLSGKLPALSFEGFLRKKFHKRFGVMGSGFVALNAWNKSDTANKWALHVHANGQITAEYLEVTNFVKRNHL